MGRIIVDCDQLGGQQRCRIQLRFFLQARHGGGVHGHVLFDRRKIEHQRRFCQRLCAAIQPDIPKVAVAEVVGNQLITRKGICAPQVSMSHCAMGDIMNGPQEAPACTRPEMEPLLSGNHFRAVGRQAG